MILLFLVSLFRSPPFFFLFMFVSLWFVSHKTNWRRFVNGSTTNDKSCKRIRMKSTKTDEINWITDKIQRPPKKKRSVKIQKSLFRVGTSSCPVSWENEKWHFRICVFLFAYFGCSCIHMFLMQFIIIFVLVWAFVFVLERTTSKVTVIIKRMRKQRKILTNDNEQY